MANWKQIQGRIRRARNSADAQAAMAELFQKTRDGMVAFDLAKLHEKEERSADAVTWYQTAYERFRRAEWRKRAAEALERLGAPVPTPSEPVFDSRAAGEAWHAQRQEPPIAPAPRVEHPEIGGSGWDTAAQIPTAPAAPLEGTMMSESESSREGPAESAEQTAEKKRRRRGRRGGRGRRGKGREAGTATVASVAAPQRNVVRGRPEQGELPIPGVPTQIRLPQPPPETELEAEPVRPHVLAGAEPVGLQVAARAADPGLASRVSRLEMQLRRLMGSPLYRLDVADQAPAGPGVYILLDSDQTTYYYIEPCKTIRAALGHLLRGGRTTVQRERPLKTDLAEHLGINESKVGKYVRDNCLVRWLQVDEGAGALAHFAISVLRPALND